MKTKAKVMENCTNRSNIQGESEHGSDKQGGVHIMVDALCHFTEPVQHLLWSLVSNSHRKWRRSQSDSVIGVRQCGLWQVKNGGSLVCGGDT